jgi:hypothetical protein
VMTGRRAVEVGLADALGSEEGVVARLQEERASPTRLRPVSERQALAAHSTRIDPNVALNPNPEEVATQMSENATQTATDGREGTDVPAADERRAEGFMAHMRSFFVGDGARPIASSREEDAEAGANDGTREDMTETTEQTNEANAGGLSAEEAEALRAQVAEYRGQAETLRGEKAELARELAETRVSAEIADAHRRGVEPWMTKAAQPDLLEAALEPDNEAAQERAARWRSTIDASKGAVKFGEEGVEEGRGFEGMTDHERVQATLEERGLGPESYEAVAAELAAKGEIRREE